MKTLTAPTEPSERQEKAVLLLEKHPLWWLWDGYRKSMIFDLLYRHTSGYWQFSRYSDPFDRIVDDASLHEDGNLTLPELFPSLKPNIDIFGVPPRTRKQRGWYQRVCRPIPPAYSDSTSEGPTPFSPFASGADIPSELVQLIINTFTFAGSDTSRHTVGHWQTDGPISITKSELGRCALVCRHWAHVCLRMAFHSVTLRSRADAVQLRTLLRSPLSRLRQYLRYIRVSPQGTSSLPWIHLLPSLFPYDSLSRKIELDLSGPLETHQKTMRSIHNALPRQIPQFSIAIGELTLRDVHFRCFDDLSHLLWEIPTLESFFGTDLTWGNASEPPRLNPIQRRMPLRQARKVDMSHCTANWPAVILSHHGLRQDSAMSWRECNVLGEIAQVIAESIPDGIFSRVMSDPFASVPGHQKSRVSQINFNWSAIRLDVVTTSRFDGSGAHDEHRKVRRGAQQEQHIAQVSITFNDAIGNRNTLAPWLAVDWHTFDDLASSCTELTSLFFQLPNEDAREEFALVAKDWLDRLSTAGKVEITALNDRRSLTASFFLFPGPSNSKSIP